MNTIFVNTTRDQLLSSFIQEKQPQFDVLADAWLLAGASTVCVWSKEKCVAHWPGKEPAHPTIEFSAEIRLDEYYIGKLTVSFPKLIGSLKEKEQTTNFLNSSMLVKRVQADADFVSLLLQSRRDLQRVTNDANEKQTQLGAMHHLAETTRVHLGVNKNLAYLARFAAHLLKAEGVFLLFQKASNLSTVGTNPATVSDDDHEALNVEILSLIADGTPILVQYPEGHWDTQMWVDFLDMLPNKPALEIKTATIEGAEASDAQIFDYGDKLLQKLSFPVRNLLLKRMYIGADGIMWFGIVNKWSGNFTQSDAQFARMLSGPTRVNIENALLHEQILAQTKSQTRIQTEIELATNVQQQLLPQELPSIAELDISARTIPALHIGGDFYDFVEHQHSFTFSVGDIAGKGMAAALFMAMTRAVLRGACKQHGLLDPHLILGQTTEHLYDDFYEVNMFATIFVGQYDTINHCVSYANAGHAPVIYCPSGEQARILEPDAPPLGVLSINLAQPHTLQLSPGDVLVVASDGFSEASNPSGELFGYDRLLTLTETLASKPADVIVKEMFEAIHAFTGCVESDTCRNTHSDCQQDDDQTLIVLKRMTI
ncbi:MAG: PP2C family protein-serine/threonine phosphatase [Chloroflexota bacterium]